MAQNEEKFNSISDLYQRVLPALKTKVAELKREKIVEFSTKDIWNYCVENKWKNKRDLRMFEIVDDILNIDYLKMKIYIKRNNTDKDD